jgi:hypothetical protein
LVAIGAGERIAPAHAKQSAPEALVPECKTGKFAETAEQNRKPPAKTGAGITPDKPVKTAEHALYGL